MYRNFRSQNFYTFGHMYCYYNVLPEAIFVVYLKQMLGGPTCKEYLSSCKISSSVVLQFWQYSSSTRLRRRRRRKRRRQRKNEKTCFAVFPGCYVEIHLFLLNLFLFVCF